MKIFICLSIIFAFGAVGYLYKERFVSKLKLANFLLSFVEYYESNLSLFKTNMVEIINTFIITQKNKNEKLIKLFQKSGQIFQINDEILKNNLDNENCFNQVKKYLNSIGQNEYEFEKEKNKNFKEYIKQQILNFEDEVEKKSKLGFKILLAIGAVVAILIW